MRLKSRARLKLERKAMRQSLARMREAKKSTSNQHDILWYKKEIARLKEKLTIKRRKTRKRGYTSNRFGIIAMVVVGLPASVDAAGRKKVADDIMESYGSSSMPVYCDHVCPSRPGAACRLRAR